MNITKNKKNWPVVKFGDVVKNANLTERDPVAAGIECVVGLEHIDPENLHISRWNTDATETSFTRKFVPGQTLFGKRRAYQRKVAYAEFEGICSSDILTFETKDTKVIPPELVPFICQSEAFFDHALGTSAGSLSPRTSWKALKDFKFHLPQGNDLKIVTDLLIAANQCCINYQNALEEIAETKIRLISEYTTTSNRTKKTQQTRLGKIPSHWELDTVDGVTTKCQYGLSIPLHETGQYPILRMMNYDEELIDPNNLKYVDLSDNDFNTFRLEENDILFNRTNSAELVGKVGLYQLQGEYVFASYLVRLKANVSRILPKYLNFYLNSKLGQQRILAYATPGVSQTNVSAGNLKKVLIPVPPIDEQQEIITKLNAISEQKRQLKQHAAKAGQTIKAIINQYFS